MQSVYVETSIIGYLASRPSSELVTAGNQQLTAEWWSNHRDAFRLFVSQAVIAECSAGDATAASERLEYLKGIPVLDIDPGVESLAATLVSGVPLPPKGNIDALHIAAAALNSMDYLLTWNCTHIANPALRRIIEQVLTTAGLVPPVICTPQELINVQ